MSMDRCQCCGDIIDTDAVPEAYVEVPWLPEERLGDRTRCWCLTCQDQELAAHGLEEFPI